MAKGDKRKLIIHNTTKEAGEYTFEVRSVSSTGEQGQPFEVKAASLPMEREYNPTKFEDIKLAATMLSTNAQETTEEPIENLVDGNVNNYFHSDWHLAWNEPHCLQLDISDTNIEEQYLRFGYVPRPNKGPDAPKSARIQTSSDSITWPTVAETTYRVPATTGDRVDGSYFYAPKGTHYLRFIPTTKRDGADLEGMLGQQGESYFSMG